MVLKNIAMKMRAGFSKRFFGLSLNIWLILLIPVGIAFFVGGIAPMVLGGEFSYKSAIVWGLFIFIVDLSLIRIESGFWVGAFRICLLALSMTITATVGDLFIFKDDIEEYRGMEMKERHSEAIAEWKVEKSAKRIEMDVEENDGGRGHDWNSLRVELEELQADKPTAESINGGVLIQIHLLHKLLLNDILAIIFFIIQAGTVVLLEMMAFALKGSTLKKQYR